MVSSEADLAFININEWTNAQPKGWMNKDTLVWSKGVTRAPVSNDIVKMSSFLSLFLLLFSWCHALIFESKNRVHMWQKAELWPHYFQERRRLEFQSHVEASTDFL